MLRVAYLFERFPSFGQTFCYREVAELVRQGAEVQIFSIRRPADEPAENWDAEIVRRVTYLPEESKLVPEIDRAARAGNLPAEAVRTLKEWGRQPDFLRLYQAAWIGLRLREADLERIHAHFAGMAARTAYWVRQFFGIEFSLTAHANDIFAPRQFAIGLPQLFEAARTVVTVSDFAVAQLRENFPQHASKFCRVYNGIDPERFPSAHFSGDIPLILSVGRLIEKKGFADLIQACALLRNDGLNFRCEIIGEGPLAADLKARITHANLEDSVMLTGPQSQAELARHFAEATVFVLPCIRDAHGDMDNLPTVIMEAMAAALPVVSTSLAGIPEMVQHDRTGVLVSPNDPPALAKAIAPIVADRTLARTLGERGRVLALDRFSLEHNAALLAEIFARD